MKSLRKEEKESGLSVGLFHEVALSEETRRLSRFFSHLQNQNQSRNLAL